MRNQIGTLRGTPLRSLDKRQYVQQSGLAAPVFSNLPHMTPSDLSPRLLAGLPNSLAQAGVPQVQTSIPVRSNEFSFNLEEAERALIAKAIAFAEGNKTKAAMLLGITREGLRKKLIRQ